MSPLRLDRLNFGGIVRNTAQMFTGAGSGLYESTALGDSQRVRSITLQDTRRSVDHITWRRLLAFARQLHTKCGEMRGPVMERATLSNSGLWSPQHIGKHTDKRTRNLYEEWAWNWMKVCDIRGQPYDFWTDMYLASMMFDRDGEACFIPTRNRNGDPRLQWIANHRIYSHTNIFQVTEKDSPYYGMKMNNGVVYDDRSAPVAYFVLEESLQFSLALKGQYIPVKSMCVMYNPDWCDQGRGVTAYAHGIRRIFDTDDIHGYLLLGIKRDAALQIIRKSQKGRVDAAADYISGGISPAGTAISLEEMQGGGIWDVTVDSKSDYTIPTVGNPRAESQDYIESIYVGVYQGLEWPYEYSRLSKESKGANIRVTCDKINHSVRKQYRTLCKVATRAVGYAVGVAVDRGELPPGEWWAFNFPTPAEMTPDKWRESEQDRENLKMGMTTLRDVLARQSIHWEDNRDQRDDEQDDKMQRCEKLYLAHVKRCEANEIEPMPFAFFVEDYEQRSPNPQAAMQGNGNGDDTEDGGGSSESKPKTKKKPKGNSQ